MDLTQGLCCFAGAVVVISGQATMIQQCLCGGLTCPDVSPLIVTLSYPNPSTAPELSCDLREFRQRTKKSEQKIHIPQGARLWFDLIEIHITGRRQTRVPRGAGTKYHRLCIFHPYASQKRQSGIHSDWSSVQTNESIHKDLKCATTHSACHTVALH